MAKEGKSEKKSGVRSVPETSPGKFTRTALGESLLSTLGYRVRTLRATKRLTRSSLADQTGLSPRFLAQLESGRGNISITNLSAVAHALEVTTSVLLGEKPLPLPEEGGEGGGVHAEIAMLLGGADPDSLRRVIRLLKHGTGNEEPPPLITLMGLRGAGKSTVGPLLAESLGIGFLELDELVQERTGLAIREIYEMHGEPYYRVAEREALEEILERGLPLVVAVSGGIVNDPFSFQLLRERTRLVWLKASPTLHMQRVQSQGDRRPMRDRPNAMAELKRLLEARHPLYRQAPTAIDTTRISPETCAERLAAELRLPQP